VRAGEIGEGRINRSVYRILRLKQRLGALGDPFVDEASVPRRVGTPEHLAAADSVTERTVTLVENDAGTLPLAAGSGQHALVTGWGVTTTSTLASHVAERGLTTDVYETGVSPTDAAIAEARRRADGSDLVIVTTNRASGSQAQQRLVRELVASGKPVIVVAVRDPYDIAYLGEAETYLATYSYARVSLKAVTKVLFGEVNPTGKLPVDVPTANDPNSILYPFGHGLGY
jgi:beta-N-acetylhexosaminidase